MNLVMIGGTPKPFACTSEGCTMTFTNEDHLNVHQRKHEMVLNFGIKSTNIVADQTPTPTRFLRNCEEVGLFQDLQNVNPFEETFRKAIESDKTGTLPVTILPEDDTLHTPHIFPHIPEENISLYSSKKHEKLLLLQSSEVTERNGKILSNTEKTETILALNGIPDHIYALTPPTIIISDSPEPTPKEVAIKTSENAKNISINKAKYRKYVGNINIKSNDTKSKLQELLLKSRKPQQIENQISTNPVIVLQNVPLLQQIGGKVPILPKFKTFTNEKLVENTQPPKQEKSVSGGKKLTKIRRNDSNKKEDLLARNRAAALRCRERKKVFIDRLEQQLDAVNGEKQVLVKENSDLKKEILHLKTLLLAHKDCPVTKAMNMGQSIPIGMPQIVENNEIKVEVKNMDATPMTISICDIKSLPANAGNSSPKRNVLMWQD